MSDIVEWLRSGGEFEDGQRAPHTTMHKAADEIERLRAERDDLRNTLDCIPNSILKAQQEIERLRAEKTELLEHGRSSYFGTPQAKRYQHSLVEARTEIERLREHISILQDEIDVLSAQRAELLAALGSARIALLNVRPYQRLLEELPPYPVGIVEAALSDVEAAIAKIEGRK
jgi:predicted  nucleic acid-binding Zn-ribbon protein